MNRRELLRAAIGSSAGIALIGLQRACLAAADLDAGPRQVVLDEREREILASISECIIPATDTPGAIDAGVPQFAELILSDWHTAEERRPVLEDMANLDADCEATYGKGFAACSMAEQVEALAATEGTPMFTMLKSLVVNGYFTSETGAKLLTGAGHGMPGVYREVVYDAASGGWV
ncbi:MAG TPA: gluconate 2-dehydrogenase subunit 3 family protein [Woeseiaceae bacterium]|nr:gluconate 2-dehydrogenase subunit 3 family protein [Woeseiaceae bacterium]